ncbi:TolC family protein [Thioalkalivibrio sp. ALE17]|uniref:TolC family protein n=1 Tax=Thioalkalivibrio sp. ALE17 TaxID=1158173 RepID=UPI001E43F79D|nr:TolC family protein [Thioalkalivibrio sp. ALE17]
MLILVPDGVQSEWYLTLSEEPGVLGESGTPAEAWSFADLAALAAQSYPSITARIQEQEAAEGDRRVAAWARFPKPGDEASVDDDQVLQAVLSLQQPLLTGGRITAGIQAAEALDAATIDEVGRVSDGIPMAFRQLDGRGQAAQVMAPVDALNLYVARDSR